MGARGKTPQPLYLRYIICYVLWLGLSAMGFWLMLQLRINIIDVAVALNVGRWSFPAIHNWSMVLLGVLWLSYTIGLEVYLHKGIKAGDLWLRIAKVFNVTLVLLLLSYLLQRLMVA